MKASATIEVKLPVTWFERADIVFDGVDQGGPSFQARVFLNNPSAHETTTPTPENGYAGAFHVYGHGRPAPARGEQVPLPITKRLVATDAIRLALQQSDQLVVSVVALPPGTPVSFTNVAIVFDPY